MKIEDLKNGKRFKLQFGNEIQTAKCINNNVEKGEVYFAIVWFWIIPMFEAVKKYDDYNFKHFETLNP